jgi:hypothetical protein
LTASKEERTYASVRRHGVGAGSIDSLMHRVDEEFAPAVSQDPGFVAYFALDTGDATVETVRLLHDEAAAEASNELAADYVRENLGECELTRTAVRLRVSRVTAEGSTIHTVGAPIARTRAIRECGNV